MDAVLLLSGAYNLVLAIISVIASLFLLRYLDKLGGIDFKRDVWPKLLTQGYTGLGFYIGLRALGVFILASSFHG